MADSDPSVKLSPKHAVTHSEVVIDFVDLPPNVEFALNIKGPIAPWWATMKTDPFGQAQLIWRTQAAGDYTLIAKGQDVDLSEDFTVNYQVGEEDLLSRGITQPDADVKTVEEPGNMGDTPSTELRAKPEGLSVEQDDPAYRPAQSAPTKTTSKTKTKSKRS